MTSQEALRYLKDITILYVEDEEAIREELVFFLKKIVFKLHVAKNGEEGYELYLKENPDLIITDIKMPKMDGLEMSKLIKDFNSNSNIVLLTAFNDTDFLFESIEVGINHYLTKPLDLNKLLLTIGKISKNIFFEKENQKNINIINQYKEVVDERSIFLKFDKDGLITHVNKTFEDISGYSLDEIINNKLCICDCLIRDNEIIQFVWKKIKFEKEIWQGIVSNNTKYGKKYYLDVLIKPILDLNDEIVEYISLSWDVSDMEKTKQYFKNQTEINARNLNEAMKISDFYKKAINKSNIILKFNSNKDFTYANQLFYEFSGYSKEELLGKNYSFLNEKKSATTNEIFSKKIWKGEISSFSKSGKEFFSKVTCIPYLDDNDEIVEYLQIRQDITQIRNLYEELQDTQREIIYKLGQIAETRSEEVGFHVKRVSEYSKLIAQKMNLDLKDIETLSIVSPMHDIGKIGIPDRILNKPAKFDNDEWEVMKTHSEIGYNLLKSSPRHILKSAAIVAYTHHEKWDGTGYPRGLKEEEIHLYGRITSIADVFDALSAKRAYKRAWEIDEIVDYFKNERGKSFEPRIVDILLENLDEFLVIKDKYKD